MIDFDNTHSRWLDRIARSEKQWDEMLIVNVMYSDKKRRDRRVYDLYFWINIEEYENLINAESQGSYYWHNWSIYGSSPKEWYSGQDTMIPDSGNDVFDETNTKPNLMDEAGSPTTVSIDGRTLQQAKIQQDNGNYDEWLEEKFGDDREQQDNIRDWLERLEGFDDLFERTNNMRTLLQTEQLTTKQFMKTAMLDIQEMFGVSLDKKFMFSQLSKITGGKLNPNQWVKYKYQLKEIYDALDKEGIKGLTKVGQRIVSAKNPLIRDRTTYKAKEAVKGIAKNRKGWLEGEEAEKAIQRFHRKTLKENAKGFKKANSMRLESKVLKDGTKVVRWRKEASIGRKIIRSAKKVLRIAKFFIL